uniref:Uncharacterized protein n=1 Tax=Anguilla anguilla TaxID=7936 RepID=A0A0E9R6W0_ANGAN
MARDLCSDTSLLKNKLCPLVRMYNTLCGKISFEGRLVAQKWAPVLGNPLQFWVMATKRL